MTQHPAGALFSAGSYAATFAPVEGGSRADLVARRLGDSIALGLLPDGSPLPPENDLAEGYGVAVVTVREALAALRRDGLIRTTRGRRGGSFVVAPTDGGRSALLTRLNGRGLADLRDLADHYATISGGCARLAAQRADEVDIALLDTRTGQDDESSFHLDLAAAAHSARLTRVELSIQADLGPMLWLAHRLRGDSAKARERHTAIVAAVRVGDGEAARSATEAHIGELFGAVRVLVAEARAR